MALTVRDETPADAEVVDAVHEAAFGRPVEARILAAIRARGAPYFGLVAGIDGDVVGHVAFGPATLQCYNAPYPVLALGPMAVRPDRQRHGIGSALVREGLHACRARGHDLVVVLGAPAFYGRFGFRAGRPMGVLSEFRVPDDVFMVAELAPGALRRRWGVVIYPREFSEAMP